MRPYLKPLRVWILVAALCTGLGSIAALLSSPVEGAQKEERSAERQDSSSKAAHDAVHALDRLGHRIGKESGKAAESTKKLFTDRFKTSPAQSK